MGDTTSIRVSRDTWKRLTRLKEPGVSYDEIINGLLDEVDSDARIAET